MNGWHVACDHTHAPTLRRSKLLLSIQRAVRIGGRAAPLLDIDVAPSTVARACCEKVRFAAGATRASAVAAGTAALGGLHCGVGEDELQGGICAATGMSTPTARIRIRQHMVCQFFQQHGIIKTTGDHVTSVLRVTTAVQARITRGSCRRLGSLFSLPGVFFNLQPLALRHKQIPTVP